MDLKSLNLLWYWHARWVINILFCILFIVVNITIYDNTSKIYLCSYLACYIRQCVVMLHTCLWRSALSVVNDMGYFPGVGTTILGHGRAVQQWWPPFWGFLIQLGPYNFIPQHNPIDLLFLQKNRFVSITLVPEILGPNVGLMIHYNVLCNRF